jgi:hypothetical protein
MSAAQILDTLCGPPMPEDVPFTVVEGGGSARSIEALAAAGLAPAGAYIAATGDASKYTAPFPLPPDRSRATSFPRPTNVTPDRFVVDAFVQRQLDKLAERFYLPHKAEVDSGRGMRDIVIMASMLEREEPTPTQRSLVAGSSGSGSTTAGSSASTRRAATRSRSGTIASRSSIGCAIRTIRTTRDCARDCRPHRSETRAFRASRPRSPRSRASTGTTSTTRRRSCTQEENAAEHEALRRKYSVY